VDSTHPKNGLVKEPSTQILKVQVLPHGEGLELPSYQTPHSAGMDLRAATESPLSLRPLQRTLIPTGIKIAIPEGYEGQVRPRSGLAFRHGLSIPNSPGTIDSDYRGEVGVILINLGDSPIEITRGMRIAQLVISPIIQPKLEIVFNIENTERGSGGFGSTGTH
jgi:dUTP pyrophosphatase